MGGLINRDSLFSAVLPRGLTVGHRSSDCVEGMSMSSSAVPVRHPSSPIHAAGDGGPGFLAPVALSYSQLSLLKPPLVGVGGPLPASRPEPGQCLSNPAWPEATTGVLPVRKVLERLFQWSPGLILFGAQINGQADISWTRCLIGQGHGCMLGLRARWEVATCP